MNVIDDDYEETTSERKSAIDEIQANITTLHLESYGHGDICDTNMTVQKDGLNGITVDWAEKIGLG
jgi:tRNA A-37 threonylcarbamoyl transferase component Bud32